MLALPVERLVGSGSSNHRSSRPPQPSSIPVSSLSPADSTASSDSSNSLESGRENLQNCPAIVSKFELIVGRRMGEVTSTTNAVLSPGKRPGSAETPDTMSPKSPPRSPRSPSDADADDPERVNNNNNHVMKVKRERLSNERSPSPVPLNLNVHFTKSNNSSSSAGISSKGSLQPLLRVSSVSESRKDHVENQSDNNSSSRTSVPIPVSPVPVVVQKKSSVNHDMNNRLDICDDRSPLGSPIHNNGNSNHCNEILLVSRPPSSNSNSNSISPQSSSNTNNCHNFIPSLSPPQSYHHRENHRNSSLKFSIEDILRPDFGHKSANKHCTPSNTTKVRTKHRANSVKSNNSSLDLSHSGGVVLGNKPSSVKNYSEDSNSSCASSSTTNTTTNKSETNLSTTSTRHHSSNRNPEVIDESKINPQIPKGEYIWPAWVYCTRYSDRPSSGRTSFRRPRSRREKSDEASKTDEEKRPRTAFTSEQLGRLKVEFDENRYLTEKRRQDLARDLKLHENQIKIWFQNKRAKLKKSTGQKGTLALQLMAQGLYNHSTIPMDEDEEMEMELASQR